ncbi:sigma-54 interaction domain-containing protein [Crassaminicella profunda]|uniref:sigma-54 interaction domain-containing protein n=1 Tax=Crassaminicella profunda TaxID=1286698 RepID=UPI001CA73EE8|nr:sigma 54-interacting transcriptional regulator [Crassaminicella profunda]QZY57277.1 sigma 54-interacting transcriptional regulator [Crassaminicella profunda]
MFIKNINGMHMDYIDAITIVDKTGYIVYSVRFNPRFDGESNEKESKKIMNKSFLETFPSLSAEDSTIIKCLKDGMPIYKNNQMYYDYNGALLNTQNITIPIIQKGKILAAIELSKDMTTIQDLSNEYKKNNKVVVHCNRSGINKNNHTSVQYSFEDIITRNHEMIENINKAKLISNSPSSVLIYGETGTGKELFVQSIHYYSARRNKPFIAQNCAALPESLFESILFGTVKGAFTGSIDKKGLFELADEGTLFLDEINAMPIHLQAKLLRVLQDGVIRRIGDHKDRKVNVRIIAAMNINPVEAIKNKQIREDIFYRLNGISIKLVPLRERKEDIPLLVKYFIEKYNSLLNASVCGVTKEVNEFFSLYSWPGNVREMQHVIEATINVIKRGKIGIKHLPAYLNDIKKNTNYYEETDSIKPLNDVIAVVEKEMIKKALEKAGWNVSKAARLLKLPRQTLQYKIIKYQINNEDVSSY